MTRQLYCSINLLDECLSYSPTDRPTFMDIRKRLQDHKHKDYYLALDESYVEFNATVLSMRLSEESLKNVTDSDISGNP